MTPLPIRVVHIVEVCRGGTAVYLQGLIDHQTSQDRRYEVHLLGPEDKLTDALVAVSPRVHYYRSSRKPWLIPRCTAEVTATLDRLSPDIIHAHGTFGGLYARKKNWLNRTKPAKVVYCAHGWSFQQRENALKTIAYAAIERRLAKRTDAIINISWDEQRAAQVRGVLAKRNIVILHGLRDRILHESKHIREPSTLHLAFIGRFDRQKGVDLLLDAWRQAKPANLKLHVVGDFDRQMGRTLETPAGVQTYGWLPNDQLDDFLSGMHMMVVPSRWEGFGLVVVEGMRNALPILASNRGALSEIVQDGLNGILFEPEEPGSLAGILSSLDADPEVARRELAAMGEWGRRLYEERFSLPRPFQAVDQLYAELLQR